MIKEKDTVFDLYPEIKSFMEAQSYIRVDTEEEYRQLADVLYTVGALWFGMGDPRYHRPSWVYFPIVLAWNYEGSACLTGTTDMNYLQALEPQAIIWNCAEIFDRYGSFYWR